MDALLILVNDGIYSPVIGSLQGSGDFTISLFDIRCRVQYKAFMRIEDVFDMYREDLEQVELWMEEALRSEVALISEIGHHLIGSGGKRFRPLLLLSAATLFGYEGEKRYPLSTVIEFIHIRIQCKERVRIQKRTKEFPLDFTDAF